MATTRRRTALVAYAIVTWILTTVWVVLMLLFNITAGALDTWDKIWAYLSMQTSGPPDLYYWTYINAVALTMSNTALFWRLTSAWLGRRLPVVAVSVYGAVNVLVYGAQLTLVPWLVRHSANSDWPMVWLRRMVHLWPISAAAWLNGVAYAVLGLSTWAVGRALVGQTRSSSMAGYLLIANSLACWVGILGLVMGIPTLAFGIVVGGGLFWVALFPLSWYLFRSDGLVKERFGHA